MRRMAVSRHCWMQTRVQTYRYKKSHHPICRYGDLYIVLCLSCVYICSAFTRTQRLQYIHLNIVVIFPSLEHSAHEHIYLGSIIMAIKCITVYIHLVNRIVYPLYGSVNIDITYLTSSKSFLPGIKLCRLGDNFSSLHCLQRPWL